MQYPSGPCVIVIGTTMLVAEKGVTIAEERSTFNVATSFNPTADERVVADYHTISFKTDGRINPAQLALIFGNISLAPGTDLFTSSPTPCYIYSVENGVGRCRTYYNVAITQVPTSLTLSTKSTIMGGNMTIMALPTPGGTPQSTNALFTDADEPFPGYGNTVTGTAPALTAASDYDIADATSLLWTANYYSSGTTPVTGFGGFYGREGIQLSLSMNTTQIADNKWGIGNVKFSSSKASASCMPVGPTKANIEAALRQQGAGAGPGTSVTKDGQSLVLTAGTTPNAVTITLFRAGLKTNGLVFDASAPQQGAAVWAAGSGTSAGAYVPPVSFAIA